ncbi:MAG: RNA polymerase subunit sigma [Lachnospiraceae bacterium]|nr:RNA polymerase subunit sigma [Lachnospiraceae bacterium]
MNEEHVLVSRVYAAKEDMAAADRLISAYLPFIRSETAKYLKRPLIEENDDELSIAMIAFHEAIKGYAKGRGAFLPFASMLIKSRLTDHVRREKRHRGHLSLDLPMGEEGDTLGMRLPAREDEQEACVSRDATRSEIEELAGQLADFGVSFTDVAENCPRQKRTLRACQKVMEYAKKDPKLLEEFLRTKRLPAVRLSRECHVEKKTLERHRKYLVALLLICTNGYEIIRGHLKHVLKGGTDQ